LRALLLPIPPTLSDDIYRYIWDGRVFAAGMDPYGFSPDAIELEALRDELWERLPHREVATVYPPAALSLFSIASRSPSPLIALKAMLVLAELIACWLLWRLAIRLGRNPGDVGWFAWNPLVTLEVAGMGHIDALGLPFILLTLLWLLPRRLERWRWGAMFTAAGAILVKIVPIVCVPLWAMTSRRPARFIVGAGALTALIALPVMTRNGVPSGLVQYGVSWEFNGPLYEPLWRLLEWIDTPAAVAAGLDQLKEMTGRHELWNRFYPFNYPRLHAKLLLAGLLGFVALWTLKSRDVVDGTGRLFGTIVLISATVYPWYLLWVLPWAALYRRTSWLALSALLFLSYLPQLTEIELIPFVYALIWGPFFALLGREWWVSR